MSYISECVAVIKCLQKAERYEDMIDEAKKLVLQSEEELSHAEYRLLSKAYKERMFASRASWRMLRSIEQNELDNRLVAKCVAYRSKVELEMKALCNDLTDLLDNHAFNQALSDESRVFLLNLKADFLRYMTEISTGLERQHYSHEAHKFFQTAYELADSSLPATSPIRLGLALNYTTFYFEILNMPKECCRVAKRAFDDAIQELDQLDEENYKETTVLMQLLRDGTTLWTSDVPDEVLDHA